MAYPVYLYKEFEDEEIVIYKFSINHYDSIIDNLDKFGRIQLNKKTKMITELTTIADVPSGLAQWVFNRAGTRIALCFRDGAFPNITEIIT
ncbi:hypothetical protein PAECIP111891_02452 [Paenibacillus allorhizoplanae]|uniref:Uncharacterized protein n=1 Tax=Paenibacillus allorhizoplanae TaxID=2905648 RepID=A0ABM9C4D8_9BACL|nr:hypothetical protein [Paenibacillus allorhizoplanae]CAH1203864.1 hypothetical protein PAECIP111891_02452 [Paenibacillus allorhizoplanae]